MKLGLLRLLTWLLARLPASWLAVLSRPLSALMWATASTRRATTRRNLELCFPDLPPAEQERLGRESMRHFVRTALETGMCWHWPLARLERCFVEPEGWPAFEQARAEGRGVLMLLPHFGNWELLSHWMQRRGGLMALYKAGSGSWVEQELLERRRRFGAEMAPTSRAGLKRIYQHLGDGGSVAVLPDQDPADGRGAFAPFYGVPALTGVLAVRLIRQTGCRAVFAACRRTADHHYRMHFIEAGPSLYSDDMDEALAAVNRGVERIVALDPAQYLWAYKRFKSRPEGEAPLYR